MIKLGAVTIGQSPRDDMVPEIEEILGEAFQIIQCGTLDDYSYEEIVEKFAPAEDDSILVSRLRDGRQVELGESHVLGLLQNCIRKLEEQGVEATLMLCTGKFPHLEHTKMLIEPQRVLHSLVSGLVRKNDVLGVIIPDRSQIEQAREWWKKSGISVEVKAASPYKDPDRLEETAAAFRNSSASLLFLDCMGFNLKMKRMVEKISGKKVILPRTMVAAVIKQLF